MKEQSQSLAAPLLVAALGLAMTIYVNRALADTYPSIVGTEAQKYPQAEAQADGPSAMSSLMILADGGYAPRFLTVFWLWAFLLRGRIQTPTHRR